VTSPATPHADPADLALALRLCDLADTMTAAAFRRRDLVVETKPDLTPVSEADRAVEEAVRAELAHVKPGDAVLGEEFGESGQGPRRWIIDPIDGTKNFVRNIPVWATLLALEEDGQLLVGVVSAPALGRRWWAGRGLGAFADVPGGPGVPIAVSHIKELGDAQLSYASAEGWGKRDMVEHIIELSAKCWRTRGFGDFWSHMLVAEGACDIGLDPAVSLWDLAALQVIVEEAGGRFTDLEGIARPDGGSAVSTNGFLHNEALAILGSRSSAQ